MTLSIGTGTAQAAEQHVFIDSPSAKGVYMRCLRTTAAKFHIPELIFYAMAKQESGWIGLRQSNVSSKTGKVMSYDHGLFQINSTWINQFKHSLSIDDGLVANNGCVNIWLAGYIYNYERKRFAAMDNWSAVGHYHSKKKVLREQYIRLVKIKYNKLIAGKGHI